MMDRAGAQEEGGGVQSPTRPVGPDDTKVNLIDNESDPHAMHR